MKSCNPTRNLETADRPPRAARIRSLLAHARAVGCVALGESGGSLIEAAISFTLLISVMACVVQASLALYSYHIVADAAREASRYAIVRGSSSCSNTPNLTNCNATSDQIQTWVRNLSFPFIISNHLSVTTTWPTTGSNCYPSSSPCNNPSNLVNVVVTYAFPLNLPMWSGGTINISSTSQMVISQ